MRYDCESIPDRSRLGLPTTASGVAWQGTCGNYATAAHSENKRKRGGRRVKRQRELWKGRRTLVKVGTLNIETMSGRGRELGNLMERRNVDILCLQETKWKGSKRRNIGRGCKIKNKYIRGAVKVEQLGMKMREGRLRWYGHVIRRDQEYVGRRRRVKVGRNRVTGKEEKREAEEKISRCSERRYGGVCARKKNIENRTLWRNMIRCDYT